MDQVDLPERENALKNLEQNQRNLENEYLNTKSEGNSIMFVSKGT